MQDVFAKLQTLQGVLSRRHRIEKEIEEIPLSLATKKELLNRLESSHTNHRELLTSLKAQVDQLGEDLIKAEKKREESEGRMETVTSQREYEVVDREIAESATEEYNLRQDLQKEKETVAELVETIEREEKMVALQKEEIEVDSLSIKETMTRKRGELKALKEEESTITPGMDEGILFKFERIIRNKAGLGIVSVTEDICGGCHMLLPAQFVNEVRLGETICFCPYCSRILFYREMGDEGESLTDGESIGILADLVDADSVVEHLEK